MNRRLFWLLCLLGVGSALRADVTVKDVSVKPRWPWNGLVDVTYSIVCKEKDEEGNLKDVYVDFTAIDGDRNQTITMKSLAGQGVKDPVKDGGPYTVTWDASKDAPALNSSELKVQIHAVAGIAPYLVVDLSGGPDAASYPVRYTSQPPNLDDDTCRTTELWLRQVKPGTFMMGSPEDEVGRYSTTVYGGYTWTSCTDMAQHEVTITQMFYIGMFECTQRQWELVMGTRPSLHNNEAYYSTRPVEYVSYNMIRGKGAQEGAGWPSYGHTVDATSFMGILQAKTGLMFDLPTEAQWEYACRAGTTTALNSGKNLTSTSSDAAMDEVGRYRYNGGMPSGYDNSYPSDCTPINGTAKVGSYLPNAWGLYDMHGNAIEWCLDWWGASLSSTAAETDPVGPTGPPTTGQYRIVRGGYCFENAHDCRSASRGSNNPFAGCNGLSAFGFRVVCLPLVR